MHDFRRGSNSLARQEQEWNWPIVPTHQKHAERMALLRPIPYELSIPNGEAPARVIHGRALSLNISSGGMLVLMDQAPLLDQVMKVHVPTPIALAETPTLAEVRWTRKLPFSPSASDKFYFVGLKFLFSMGDR